MKKAPLTMLLSALALTAVTNPASAADIAAGKEKAKVCFSCHGEDGRASIPEYPHLAGQQAKYLEIALKAYADGSREDPTMAPMAKALTAEDIRNVSAYFASLSCR